MHLQQSILKGAVMMKGIIRITIRVFIPIETVTKEDVDGKKDEHESATA